MRWIFLLVISALLCACSSEEVTLTFYRVPLVCGAAPEIGCGSRAKPFFIDAEKETAIKETWLNREGTVIAIVWSDGIPQEEKEKIIRPLFEKHSITAEMISDPDNQKVFSESFYGNLAPAQKADKWYRGMDVDQLSLEEAGVVADSATAFAVRAKLITPAESESIKKDIEAYMKSELVKVRTYKELTSMETDMKWKQYGYEMYVKYIGTDRAEKVRDYFFEYQKKITNPESCCDSQDSKEKSEITCPHCSHKTIETMPTDVCQIVYACKNCKKEIRAKEGDCCVFCSYGTHKCPSKQE